MEDNMPSVVVHEINEVSTDPKHYWIVKFEENFKEFRSTRDEKQPEEKKQPEERENTNMYKIPVHLCKNFDDIYAPCKVSFGPYHQGQASCQPVEDIKERIVCHSLVTSKKKIHDYVDALNGVLKDLKEKYGIPDQNREEDEAFLRLMIFDGCFFLEVLRAANNNILDSPVWDIDGVSPDKLMEGYRHDMLLLENQLPMLVLEKLLDVQHVRPVHFRLCAPVTDEKKADVREYLNRQMIKFFFPRVLNLKILPKECLHVLDWYRHGLLTQELRRESKVQNCLWQIMTFSPMRILFYPLVLVILALVNKIRFLLKLLIDIFRSQPATEFHFSIPSATDLDDVGIGFTSKMKGLRNISYGRRTLSLPQISVDDTIKSIFFNLIAFEKLHKDAEKEVTSYIYFMNGLIKHPNDVHHLQRCGIIDSRLEDEDIHELFKSLTTDTGDDPDNFMVSRYRDISERLKNGFPKMNKPWRKDLWQTCLKSPWAFVSVLAAFLLFALSVVQTAYTVLGYYNLK